MWSFPALCAHWHVVSYSWLFILQSVSNCPRRGYLPPCKLVTLREEEKKMSKLSKPPEIVLGSHTGCAIQRPTKAWFLQRKPLTQTELLPSLPCHLAGCHSEEAFFLFSLSLSPPPPSWCSHPCDCPFVVGAHCVTFHLLREWLCVGSVESKGWGC